MTSTLIRPCFPARSTKGAIKSGGAFQRLDVIKRYRCVACLTHARGRPQRRRALRVFTVPSVRRRVNPYSVPVGVRATSDKLRFARRGRRCVCMNGDNQGYREDDSCESFHVDLPGLYQCGDTSTIPLGECQQRRIGQLVGVQPFSKRKAAVSAGLTSTKLPQSRGALLRVCPFTRSLVLYSFKHERRRGRVPHWA